MIVWERMDTLLSRGEHALLVACLAIMMVTAFVQIAARNLFGIGLTWSEPLVRYLVLWVGFLGAALAVREGRHITIELTSLWAPARDNRVLQSMSHLASALVCAVLAVAAARFVHDEAQIGGETLLSLPAWVPELIIPFTFAVMTLRFLLRAALSATRRPSAAPSA